jgi:hypothetical protein
VIALAAYSESSDMAHTLYLADKGADALKLCVCASVGDVPLTLSVLPAGKAVPDTIELPLPSAGCPVLCTADGGILQNVNAASIYLGTVPLPFPCCVRMCPACICCTCTTFTVPSAGPQLADTKLKRPCTALGQIY